jgi:hypothetical protein
VLTWIEQRAAISATAGSPSASKRIGHQEYKGSAHPRLIAYFKSLESPAPRV